MPKFLETKLKKEYGANSKIPYAVMNKLGYMHGNKETPAGKMAEAKHAAHQAAMRHLSRSDHATRQRRKR